jgi:fermentation-respiration switch protein FrsA (DUF1100 family)
MFFIYILLLILGILYFKKSVGPSILRVIGFLIGSLFLGTSVFYSSLMPIVRLEEPSGMYAVGKTNLKLQDQNRPERHSEDPSDCRKLFVEIWYPTQLRPKGSPASMWSGLYSGKADIISFLTNYLHSVKTHSYNNLKPADKSYPLVLFNHGLQMFSSQNTLLMEHLASHGYIVASIAHPYESIRVDLMEDGVVIPDFMTSWTKFKEGMSWIRETSAPILETKEKLQSITDPEARSAILLETILKAEELNKTVYDWSKDNRFVLNFLLKNPKPLVKIPDIDRNRIGVMGMSIGGAVAGELCKVDPRFKAGINIDGLPYGTAQRDSLKVPFMIFNSDDGAGMNDITALHSKQDFYEYHLVGSRHADLTDMAILWPVLKIYGQFGKHKGKLVMEILNASILDFWDHHLKGNPETRLTTSSFPEIVIQSKIASSEKK